MAEVVEMGMRIDEQQLRTPRSDSLMLTVTPAEREREGRVQETNGQA